MPRFPKLRPPYLQDAKREVHIRTVETDGLIHPHPRHHQQSKKSRECVSAEPLAGPKTLSRAKQPTDFRITIDVRSLASVAILKKTSRGDFGARLTGPEPSRKVSHHPQTCTPGSRLGWSGMSSPAKSQFRGDVRRP